MFVVLVGGGERASKGPNQDRKTCRKELSSSDYNSFYAITTFVHVRIGIFESSFIQGGNNKLSLMDYG